MKIKTQAQVVAELKLKGWERHGRKTSLGSIIMRGGPMCDRREKVVYFDGSVVEYAAGRA